MKPRIDLVFLGKLSGDRAKGGLAKVQKSLNKYFVAFVLLLSPLLLCPLNVAPEYYRKAMPSKAIRPRENMVGVSMVPALYHRIYITPMFELTVGSIIPQDLYNTYQ